MRRSRVSAYLLAAIFAVSLAPGLSAAADTEISCPATVNFKIRAQNPPSGWEESANDILGQVVTSQVHNISSGRWLLTCGYNAHNTIGLISKQVSSANCRTPDNARVSRTGKFVCH